MEKCRQVQEEIERLEKRKQIKVKALQFDLNNAAG